MGNSNQQTVKDMDTNLSKLKHIREVLSARTLAQLAQIYKANKQAWPGENDILDGFIQDIVKSNEMPDFSIYTEIVKNSYAANKAKYQDSAIALPIYTQVVTQKSASVDPMNMHATKAVQVSKVALPNGDYIVDVKSVSGKTVNDIDLLFQEKVNAFNNLTEEERASQASSSEVYEQLYIEAIKEYNKKNQHQIISKAEKIMATGKLISAKQYEEYKKRVESKYGVVLEDIDLNGKSKWSYEGASIYDNRMTLDGQIISLEQQREKQHGNHIAYGNMPTTVKEVEARSVTDEEIPHVTELTPALQDITAAAGVAINNFNEFEIPSPTLPLQDSLQSIDMPKLENYSKIEPILDAKGNVVFGDYFIATSLDGHSQGIISRDGVELNNINWNTFPTIVSYDSEKNEFHFNSSTQSINEDWSLGEIEQRTWSISGEELDKHRAIKLIEQDTSLHSAQQNELLGQKQFLTSQLDHPQQTLEGRDKILEQIAIIESRYSQGITQKKLNDQRIEDIKATMPYYLEQQKNNDANVNLR